jgi:hypothetical protein
MTRLSWLSLSKSGIEVQPPLENDQSGTGHTVTALRGRRCLPGERWSLDAYQRPLVGQLPPAGVC